MSLIHLISLSDATLYAQDRLAVEWTPEMERAASRFYFNHYRVHFSIRSIADVLCCIPQVLVLHLP